MESNNKVSIMKKVILIILCIVLSIVFSFGLKTYIDYQKNNINEEDPVGAPFYCAAGKYANQGECKTCPAGSYCSGGLYASAYKNACPSGKTSPAGSSDSTQCYCPSGKYMNNGVCTTCPVGYKCDGSTKTACSGNEYQGSTGKSTCSSCSTYVVTQNSLNVGCRPCSPGSYHNGSGCVSCPVGYKCDGASKSACTGSYYQDTTGATSCKLCTGTVNSTHTYCGQCSKGYFMGQNNCEQCTAGYYCENGTSRTACPDGTTSSIGAKSSSDCYELEDSSICTVTVSTKSQAVSVGSYYVVSVSVNGKGCNGQKLTYSATNSASISKTSDSGISSGSTYSFNVTPDDPCKSSRATAKLTNGNSDSITVSSVYNEWHEETGCWKNVSDKPHSKNEADRQGKHHYYSNPGTCDDGTSGYRTHGYRYYCGNPESSTPKACYKDADGNYIWGEYSKNNNYNKIESISKELECFTPVEVEDCVENNVIPASESKTATCNGSTSFASTATKSCEVNNSPYYKITCIESLDTKFVPSELVTIKLGLGFKYDVNISTKRICEGKFYSDLFLEAYQNVLKKLNSYSVGTADYQTYLTKKQDLLDLVKNYNKWSSNYDFDGIKATLTDSQTSAVVNFIEKDDSKKINKGEKQQQKKHSLNISGITDPIDFKYEENLSKTMTLPLAYYNLSNKVVYNNCSNCIKLTNQYYISDNQKYINTDYKYTVNVTGLGYNKNWSVKTNDCSLKVVSDPSIYRPTDINDPFLNEANPNRETGKNWLSETLDFTSIIKSDTWKQNSLYEFNITSTNVKEIRKNNQELGANAYIGTDCKLITATNRYYCSFLRNSQYFQYHYIYTDNIH